MQSTKTLTARTIPIIITGDDGVVRYYRLTPTRSNVQDGFAMLWGNTVEVQYSD